MRFAILAPALSLSALLAPLALWADTLTVDSAPGAVTVYPYRAGGVEGGGNRAECVG